MTRSPTRPAEPTHPLQPGRRAVEVKGRATLGPRVVEPRVLPSYDPPTRARRLRRAAASLVGVVLIYCAYDLLAVPFIEPSADLRPADTTPSEDLQFAREAVGRQREELAAWFAPGDWELTSPKALQSPKGMLLLKDYKTLPDGSVEIKPCTLVFLPQGQFASEADRRRRAIVLQAPLAILKFDTPLDLKHATIGKPVGGKLVGPITIRSDQREPGPHDDLWLTTRDVELNGDRLTTPHPVEFRLGQSAGRGRNLAITLAPADADATKRGLAFGGMRSLELADSVWMRVQPGQANLFPSPTLANDRPAQTSLAAGGARSQPQPPLEVECAGAFHFDMEKSEATFERTVVVSRVNVNGPSDQLTCERLSLLFETVGLTPVSAPVSGASASGGPPAVPSTPTDTKAGFPKLELARIVATGSPVIIRSPSRGAQARGQRLEYNVKAQSGSLSGPGTLKGVAPAAGDSGGSDSGAGNSGGGGPAVGGLAAGKQGPNGPRPIEAVWSEQLVFRSHEGNQVLSIEGDADVQVVGAGRIRAGEIHLWLIEQADPSRSATAGGPLGRGRLVPARLLARGREKKGPPQTAGRPTTAALTGRTGRPKPRDLVKIESPELTGEVGELRAWFDYAAEASLVRNDLRPGSVAARPAAVRPGASSPNPPDMNASMVPSREPSGDVWLGASNPSVMAPPHALAGRASAAAPPLRQYHMNGDLVQLQIVVRGRVAEVTEVDIDGAVRFAETQTAQPDEVPLRVAGDHVHVQQPRPQAVLVSVAGQPAHVEARGMTIDAGTIKLDRAGNHAWVEGPGTMTFPVDRDMEGRPLARPQRIELTWKQGMDFDGQRARFDGDVLARLEEQRLSTATLVATFRELIRFGEGGPQTRPDVERLDCSGGVFLERRARDKTGRLTSIERLQSVDLAMQQRTGDMTAHGPGWVNSVRIDTGEGLPGRRGLAGGAAAAGQPPDAPVDAPRREVLVYLGVHFRGDIVGNQQTRVMEFQREVQTVYGPVVDWEDRLDPDDFDGRRDHGVLMKSDRLQVAQAPALAGQDPTYVLAATGNTTVDGNYEGTNYWANAARLTYEEAKDLLVLEGDGREPAQLFRQEVVGGERQTTVTNRILFHPKTNVVTGDIRSLEASNFGGLPRAPRGRAQAPAQ